MSIYQDAKKNKKGEGIAYIVFMYYFKLPAEDEDHGAYSWTGRVTWCLKVFAILTASFAVALVMVVLATVATAVISIMAMAITVMPSAIAAQVLFMSRGLFVDSGRKLFNETMK